MRAGPWEPPTPPASPPQTSSPGVDSRVGLCTAGKPTRLCRAAGFCAGGASQRARLAQVARGDTGFLLLLGNEPAVLSSPRRAFSTPQSSNLYSMEPPLSGQRRENSSPSAFGIDPRPPRDVPSHWLQVWLPSGSWPGKAQVSACGPGSGERGRTKICALTLVQLFSFAHLHSAFGLLELQEAREPLF